jgi:hypothetical protein
MRSFARTGSGHPSETLSERALFSAGVWLFCMSGSLYGVFLYHQTKTHSYYFDQPPERGGAGQSQSQSQSPRRDEDSGSISSDLERQQQLATPGMHDRHPRAVAEDDEGGGHARRRDRRGSIGVVAPVVVTPTHGHEDMEVRFLPPDKTINCVQKRDWFLHKFQLLETHPIICQDKLWTTTQ